MFLRLKVKGERDLITVVGHTPSVPPGEYASASGQWLMDKAHGRQFKATFLKIAPPTTLAGIERYLGSGMVKGIGPAYSARLVRAFGADVFDVIEKEPSRLREVGGIGAKRANKIISGWGSDRVAAITANFSPLPPSRINERLCNYPCPNVTMRPCALQKCIAI
ncbi:helicase, RecD/TraA family [Klebsiella pneumoniae]|nr:helicase, RecD/TraA family [Klebsiella pneumoniae]